MFWVRRYEKVTSYPPLGTASFQHSTLALGVCCIPTHAKPGLIAGSEVILCIAMVLEFLSGHIW